MIKSFLNHQLKYGPLFKQRLKKISRYYNLSIEQQDELEAEKLKRLVQNAYKKSTFYRNLYDKYGINISQIQTREDLKKLPVLKKNDIRGYIDQIYIGGLLKHTAYTSGTSGQSLKVYYSVDCILNEASYNEIFRNNAGHYVGQRVISLRGVLGHKQLKKYDRFSNTLFLSSFNLNEQNFLFYYNEIKHFKPNAILAYPSSLEILANLLLQNNKELHIPVIFTSSETLYDFQRKKIEKAFNTVIYDRYGNAERTISLVQEKPHGDYKEAKLYSVNEYLENKIITTNLISPTFPLIRYEVEDRVEIKPHTKEVSVKEIIGRIDDVLILPNGTEIGRMNLVFREVNHILFAQIVQEKKDFFIINLVVDEKFNITEEERLKQNIKNQVGEDLSYQIKFIAEEQLIKSKRGKYKLVINKIKESG